LRRRQLDRKLCEAGLVAAVLRDHGVAEQQVQDPSDNRALHDVSLNRTNGCTD
jgi:hypothetical protein